MKRIDTTIIKKVKDGGIIIEEGTWPQSACVLIGGKAKVFKNVDDRHVLIGSLSKGDIFGEMGFLEDIHSNVSVVADGDVIAEIISRDTFLEFFDKFPRNVQNRLHSMISNLTLCMDSINGV